MIFVTIGMNDAPFGEMFRIIDELAPTLGEEVVMQIGNTEFTAKNSTTYTMVTDDEIQKLFDRASLIIAHAGMGTILNGLNRNIPLVLVPRNVVMEVERDQQEVIARKVESMGRGVRVSSLDELPAKIEEARKMELTPYKQSTQLVDNLSKILDELQQKKLAKKKKSKVKA